MHFVLKTSRIIEQVAFYKSFLNAWEVFESENLYFLTYDDEHHRLAIYNVKNLAAQDQKTAGIDHIAYSFETIGDMLANYLRLKDEGILPFWCINHGMSTSLYYRDPDGNGVEMQVDNLNTAEEHFEYFRSDLFRADPLGVQFDPDRMVELYREGWSEADLKRQGIAPRAPGTEYNRREGR